ncbi:MAG: 6-phosphogluconolactonase, partial [Gaiella sp.]
MDAVIRVERDAEAASVHAASLLVEAVRAGASIGLSGGSTPTRTYELAVTEEPDWSAASAWLVDERFVPGDDPRSNGRLVAETILRRAQRRPAWHPVATDAAS